MISLNEATASSQQSRQQATAQANTARVVAKPVPQSQTQDPRGYQISQLQKRFSAKESKSGDGSSSLTFRLSPSDPDFPFELAHLDCDLRLPKAYPAEKPELRVRNKDIPRGFSINIERGWDNLVLERKGATLLALVHALDKNLETFLTAEKVETVKLVTYRDTRHLDNKPSTGLDSQPVSSDEQKLVPVQTAPAPAPRPYIPERTYTREEITDAKARRAQETRQLEARMNRLLLYRRSADGVVYTLPIEIKRKDQLPAGLRSVNNIHLIVPLLYPLQSLRLQINDADAADAEPIEDLFVERAEEQKQMTLMSHVNYLAQNMHNLAKQAKERAAKLEQQTLAQKQLKQKEPDHDSTSTAPKDESFDNSHVKVIPRPPEWNLGADDGDSSSEDYTDSDGGGVGLSDEEAREKRGGAEVESTPKIREAVERGTMFSFPSIELYSIELLQVTILSLTVKCERCKTANDITGLKPEMEKTSSCKKCGTALSATFHPQLVHEHSSRAGFLDLTGCKVVDMLPSTFVPTCAKCSTQGLALVSVRGESVTNVCRECHGKFTFKIADVKFLFITPGTRAPPTMGPRRKAEKLGLQAGENLPNRGACAHYRKSFRWFRFSCCSKVHACNMCHDDAEDHINEWANRMICGWCSREQNYAVESCTFCGRGVIGRKGTGFWEGGKGTRDQRMMNRKDPRKYKRLGASKA